VDKKNLRVISTVDVESGRGVAVGNDDVLARRNAVVGSTRKSIRGTSALNRLEKEGKYDVNAKQEKDQIRNKKP
jgi:hypothetical protein